MTGPEISMSLHHLVRDGVIANWHRRTRAGRTSWVIVPHAGPCTPYTRAGIVDYIEFAREVACV